MLKLSTSLKKSKKRVVAVSWDNRELLCLVASGSAESLRLDHTFRILCEDEMSDEEAAEQLADRLKEQRLTNYDLLIALPRSQVDVINLKLPQASSDELPLLVRNEIMRQSGDATESSLIDYETPVAPEESEAAMTVSGAVVRGDAHARIETIATALRQKPSRIVVRAHAIASMFRRHVPHPPKSAMLLNLMQTSADISILNEREIVFTRNVQLGGETGDDDSTDVTHLADEIRLTTIVAPQDTETDDAALPHVYIFGDPNELTPFTEELGREAQLEVTLLDPLRDIELPSKQQPPANRQRLAALIGMVWDFLEGSSLLDFANPKQPPARPNTVRKIAFYAAAALSVLAIVGFRLHGDVSDVQGRASELQAEVEHSGTLLKTVRNQTLALDAVERWREDQTDWLSELHYLSTQLPPADKAVVQRLTFVPSNRGRGHGSISMSMRVADPTVIKSLDNGLRDARHEVNSERIAPTGGDASAVQFETRIQVLPAPVSSEPSNPDSQ